MRTSKNGIDLIKEFEGCVLTAYRCPAGVLTIGYGHTAGVVEGMKITKGQAEQYLVEDLKKYEAYVNSKAFVPLTNSLNQNQFDALVSFCYNCGCGNLKKLCAGKSLEQISKDMLLYNKAKGKVLAGLVRRRNSERALFNSPVENSTTTSTATSTEKSVEELAREVIQGKWGNGAERKRRLTQAGYSYAKVQAMVNKLLR